MKIPDNFQSLSEEEQTQFFFQISFKDKGEVLELCNDPGALTRSLSPEEFCLLVREMDRDERIETFGMATIAQLSFFADIECWDDDRLDGDKFSTWLTQLGEADENRLMAWFQDGDPEMVILGFKKVIEVVKPEWEYAADELLGDRPFFTLDNMYYVLVSTDDIQGVRRAVELLFERDRGRYMALLEGVLSEQDDMIEEEAYRFREVRLTERGFPDKESSAKLFQTITREQFRAFPLKKESDVLTGEDLQMPGYILLAQREDLFLDHVLASFAQEPNTLELIHQELVWLSNKILARQGISLIEESRVRKAVSLARHFVNIGLEALSAGNQDAASRVMKERWLELVFRTGFTEVVRCRELSQECLKKYWDGDRKAWLLFLDEPYDAIIEGVMSFIPVYYDLKAPAEELCYRDFTQMQDVNTLYAKIDELVILHETFELHGEKMDSYLLEHLSNLANSSLYAFTGTGFARFVLEGRFNETPISVTELMRFLELWRDAGPEAIAEWSDKFINRYFSGELGSRVRGFWNHLWKLMREETLHISSNESLEKVHLSTFFLKEETDEGI